VAVSADPVKLSDANWGGQTAGDSYSQNHFQGRVYAIMLYKPRLSSRAERQAVQEYLLDRYGQRCPPNVNPGVNTTCSTFRVAGSSCTQTCLNGTVRVGGPAINAAQTATLPCVNGVYVGKSLVCAAQCSVLLSPPNVGSCRKAFVAEDFSRYDGNVTSVFSLVQYSTAPALPAGTADRRFFFAGDSLVGAMPARNDECSVTTTPTTLLTSLPAWAEASSPPVDPVVHEAVFSLDSPSARGGIAFRTSVNGGDVNMYRFTLGEGVLGAVFENVTGAGVTLALRQYNATETFTLVPALGVTYRVACSLRFATGEISCSAGPSGGDASTFAFAFSTIDDDIPFAPLHHLAGA
jgi:hypothetical protein